MCWRVRQSVQTICGWPTDTFAIDYDGSDVDSDPPHTVLLFIPGNPGCCSWYQKLLLEAVKRLGRGYAVRATSYASHGVGANIVGSESGLDNDGRSNAIAWTIDGQVEHKIQWIDELLATDFNEIPRFIFLCHSIGAHLVQRLCVIRDDILERTDLLVHLMPFIRFDPCQAHKKTILSTVAHSPNAAVHFLWTASRLASKMPKSMLDKCLKYFAGVDDNEGRKLALELVISPRMAKNFLTLGMEEIREVPERHDDESLRIIGRHCDTAMLFCGGPDHWAPHFHLEELEALRKEGKLPNNIYTEYKGDLVHDFVVHVKMVEPVVDFICRQIKSRPPPQQQQLVSGQDYGASPSEKYQLIDHRPKIRSKL
mmetsp:Transcript_4310/g.12158  ORF Transcript_4310/g.12158 Transcript_4310/m.12158 type:complete len:368 (-) Transcript_4310:68-1171(-)